MRASGGQHGDVYRSLPQMLALARGFEMGLFDRADEKHRLRSDFREIPGNRRMMHVPFLTSLWLSSASQAGLIL